MNKNDLYYYNQLIELIKISAQYLDDSAYREIEHYLKHDEYEMAFEGLIIELIKNKIQPDSFDFINWKEIAVFYNLDKCSVFLINFWNEFVEWVEYK